MRQQLTRKTQEWLCVHDCGYTSHIVVICGYTCLYTVSVPRRCHNLQTTVLRGYTIKTVVIVPSSWLYGLFFLSKRQHLTRKNPAGSQFRRFPPRAGNLLDKKKQTTTRLPAKSLLPLQSLVYKADSPLLQLSRTDGGTHRRSKVNRRRRPGGRVRRRGPIVCADERLIERCCC